MPYDKETRDALHAYYETHDFTGSIPAFDDKKYTPAQLRIYGKAKKFFAQSWLKLLPETGNKRSMRNFSKNYPLNCLKEGDAAYIADMVAGIMGDEKQFKASIDKFFSDLQGPLETGFKACAKAHGKTPEELTDEEIEDVVDKLAGLFMEEMINALMTAQKTPEIFAALHKGDTKLTAHEDFNDSVCENHDKINFLKRWTHSDTQLGAVLSLEEVMATDRDAVENASDFFSPTESTEEAYAELRNGFLATLSEDDRTIFIMRENGKTQKDIAEALGYKTHSAVTKRLQAMREQFEMYIKKQS